MGGSLKDLVKKINDVGDKTKKIADIVYLFGLVFFMTSQACGGARVVFVDFVRIFLLIGSAILFVSTAFSLLFLRTGSWGCFHLQSLYSVLFILVLLLMLLSFL